MTHATKLSERLKRLGSILRFGCLRDARGSSVLEVALMMPLFTLILLGAAEFGRLAYYSIEVSNAAYAGATYAAQTHATAANTSAIQLAASADAANTAGLSVTSTNSCSCSDGTPISCSNAAIFCLSPARIVVTVQVNTVATVNSLFNYPGFPSTYALHGQAIERVEQ